MGLVLSIGQFVPLQEGAPWVIMPLLEQIISLLTQAPRQSIAL